MKLKYTSLQSRNPDFVRLSGELWISRFPSVFSQDWQQGALSFTAPADGSGTRISQWVEPRQRFVVSSIIFYKPAATAEKTEMLLGTRTHV